MSTQLECSALAALCMKLAKREPANRILWMAEAENWSRLSKQRLRGEAGVEIEAGHRVKAMAKPNQMLT
jgi:hypothetical protein